MATEELLTCSSWFDPKIVVPAVCVIVASVIVPLLLHYLKGIRERNGKIFEIRRSVYSEYFKKYEDAAAGLGQDYEHFSQVTLKDAFYDLLESKNSSESVVRFQQTVGSFPHKIQDSFRKTVQEITNIKIFGSTKLLELTNGFEALNKEMLDLTPTWLNELKGSLANPDFDAPITKKLKSLGKQAEDLKEQIILQMRIELGIK